MRFGFAFFICLVATAHAARIQTFTGDVYEGECDFDTGLIIRPPTGPIVKLDYLNVQRARFREGATTDTVAPGILLKSGSRLACTVGPLSNGPVALPSRGFSIPGTEIAWIVFQPFAFAIAANAPGGKTGALLPGGDFFEGTIKSADGATARVNNAIFGPRTFKDRDALALIVADVKPAPAIFELLTVDGSLYAVDAIAASGAAVMLRHALFTVKVDPKDIVELRAGPGRSIALAELKPARVIPSTGFAAELGGFSTTVNTAATWEIPAGMSVLAAQIAVPASVPAINKLTFAVYADGRPVFRSQPLSSESPPQTIRVVLGAARALSLRVEPHFPTNAAGAGLWTEPTLLRK